MIKGSKEISKLWIYAVVLFSSALIVLVLTAYSQIKLNSNISDYRMRLSNIEKKNDDFELNLNSAIKINKQLNEEISYLNEKINEFNVKVDKSEKNASELNVKLKNTIDAYEALISAQIEFDKGNVVECAEILRNGCDISYFHKDAVEKYNSLVKQSYKKAAHKLYQKGYSDYKKKNYQEAIKNFELSADLDPNQYYSDDCYYFAAYSYYKIQNHELANKTIMLLFEKYPKSSYTENAERLLEKLKG